MELLRSHIGAALRSARISREKTLRQVAASARVSLGYLSEVERGQKEASSELLNAICHSLELSLSTLLQNAGTSLEKIELPTLAIVDSKSSQSLKSEDAQATFGSNAA